MDNRPLALIVEDNEDQNLVFTMALHHAGYKTESFQDGLMAQKRLTEISPAVVVLDLHVPGVNGEVLLGQIRSSRQLKDTRVILATADAGLASLLQPEADLILLKPISFAQLNKLAVRLLHQPRYADTLGDDTTATRSDFGQ
jgi:CheY-like chemotaxis protein